jgi:hypothetical protein
MNLDEMYEGAMSETEKVLLKDRDQFISNIKLYVQGLKGQDLMMYIEDYRGCTRESEQIKYHLASEEQDRRIAKNRSKS